MKSMERRFVERHEERKLAEQRAKELAADIRNYLQLKRPRAACVVQTEDTLVRIVRTSSGPDNLVIVVRHDQCLIRGQRLSDDAMLDAVHAFIYQTAEERVILSFG